MKRQTAGPVALVDLAWTGHHPAYFKLFARILLERGHEVIALCPAPGEILEWARAEHPALADRISAIGIAAPTRPPPVPFATLVQVIRQWNSVRSALDACKGTPPRLVLFAWIDTLLHPLLPAWVVDRLFRRDWAALYLQPRPLRTGLQIPALRSRKCRGIFVLNENIGAALSEAIGGKRVYDLPDIADTSAPDPGYPLARTVRDRAADRTVVGLVGGLAPRKGIMVLLRAAGMLPPDRFFFVFAGHLIEESFSAHDREALRRFSAAQPENCLFHFHRIPEEAQFNAMLEATDVVFAAYLDFPHSSNLVAKAAFLRKPLIVSRGHLMAQRVARYRLGLEIDEGDARQCADAIRKLAAPGGEAAPDYAAYSRDHSPARFEAVFERALLDMR